MPGHGCWDGEPLGTHVAEAKSGRTALEAAGDPSRRQLASADDDTCSRLHLGREYAKNLYPNCSAVAVIQFPRMKSPAGPLSYIDSDQNNKTDLSYPILS